MSQKRPFLRHRTRRTDLWFWYGAILDWWQNRKNEEAGIVLDPQEKAGFKTYVDTHGPNYYKPAVRKAIEAAEHAGAMFEVPDDPWDNKWTTTDLASMFTQVEGKVLYDMVYRQVSEWIHWGPARS